MHKVTKHLQWIFILCVIFQLVFAQQKKKEPLKNFSIVDPKARYYGISLVQNNHGSGLGFFYDYANKKADRIFGEVNFISIKGFADYPVYDYYTGMVYEREDRRRLILAPIYLGYKKVLFKDGIANNFRPFIGTALGPVIGIDPPNIPEFSERIKRIRFHYTYGFQFMGGIEFFYGPGTVVSIFAGYQRITFKKNIDLPEPYMNEIYQLFGFSYKDLYHGQRKFNGFTLKLGFGKRS